METEAPFDGLLIKPLKETDLGVAQAFADP